MYLKDLNGPVRNYALFADLNAGQAFHIRSSDKTSQYYHCLCLNCCLHTVESDAGLLIVVCQIFPPPPNFSVLSECTKRKNGERKHALSACVYSGNLAGGLELKQSSVYSLICRWEARSRFQTTITQNET